MTTPLKTTSYRTQTIKSNFSPEGQQNVVTAAFFQLIRFALENSNSFPE